MNSTREALDFILRAVEAAGYKPGGDVLLGTGPARPANISRTARTAWKARGRPSRPAENADFLAELASAYPIASIEDGMDEDDAEGGRS